MSRMHVLDRGGDTKLIWDPGNADEVQNARETFDRLTGRPSQGGKGFTAYRVGDEGKPGEVLREFDPDAEKMIIRPAMGGG